MKTRPNADERDLESPDSQPSNRRPTGAGESGDTQGLSPLEDEGSESVQELLEEGQYYEAEVLSGIEEAPPADVSEVKTRQVPEDDVPLEYLEDNERDT